MNIQRKQKNRIETQSKTKSNFTNKLHKKQQHLLSKPKSMNKKNSPLKNSMSFTTLNSNNFSKSYSSKVGGFHKT
jgi:hypothetical protein